MKLTAARIGPAHGLRGEAILDVRTDDPRILFPGAEFETDSLDRPRLCVDTLRSHKGRLLVSFVGVNTREAVETLRGVLLLVDAHDEEDAWYPHQLEGLCVRTSEGQTLGTVAGVRSGAAQDLLLVRAETTGEIVMVPFVRQLVPLVDVDGGYVIIDPPGGLFDDEVIDGPDGSVH